MAAIVPDPAAASVLPSAQPMPTQSIQASPDDFGAQAGQALSGTGQQLDAMGNMLAAHAQQFQAENNATLATDAETQYMSQLGDTYAAYRQKSGQDAFDSYPDYQAKVAQIRQDIAASLPNPEAQKSFNMLAGRHEGQTLQAMALYAGDQRKTWMLQSSDSAVNQEIDLAAQFANDDNRFGQAIGTIKFETARQAQIAGWPVEKQAEQQQAYTDKAWATRIARVAQVDPMAAQSLFERATAGDAPQIGGLAQERIAAALKPLVDAHTTQADAATAIAGLGSAAATGSAPGGDPANNLGNLMPDGKTALGFATPEAGAAATATNLRDNYRGLNLAQIAEKWAPAAAGNDPTAWASNVAAASGLAADTAPNLDDPGQLRQLVSGIAVAEQSKANLGRFTPAVIGAGVDSALSGQPVQGAAAAPAGTQTDVPAAVPEPGSPPVPPLTGPPTAASIVRANYAAGLAQVDALADQRRPGDAVYLQQARSAYIAQTSQVLHAQEMSNEANQALLVKALSTPGPDGQLPTTRAQLFAMVPGATAAYTSLQNNNPTATIYLDRMLETNGRGTADVAPTPDNQSLWYRLRGQADADPTGFAGQDLMNVYGQMPFNQWTQLANIQAGLKSPGAQSQDRQQLLNNALSNRGVGLVFGASGLNPPKPGTAANPDYQEAAGRLSTALQAWRQDNPGKSLPGDGDLQRMAADITQQVRVKLPWSDYLGGYDVKPLYRINAAGADPTPLDRVSYAVPPDFLTGVTAAFRQANGRDPNPGEVNALYHMHLVKEGVAR